jgi:O-antigen ligase
MTLGNAFEIGADSGDAAGVGARQSVSRRHSAWLLIWSLLLGGVNVHFGDRAPVVLYFDIVLVLWLAVEIYWRRFFPDFSGWIVGLGAFCFLSGTLSTLVNLHDVYKSLAALKILGCSLLVYAIVRKARPSALTLSLWGATVGVLLLANYRAVQYGVYEGEAGLKDEIGIVLGRSNYVASILLLLIPLAVGAGFAHRGKMRVLFVGCAMVMFSGLVVTMSRGAMLAMVVAAVLSLPLMHRAGVRVKHVLAVVFLGVVTVFLLPSDILRADAALVTYRWENPDLGRAELIKASLRSFVENPVLGVGPGQLGRAIAARAVVPEYDQQYMNAHNLVLDALAENGLPAGLALLVMVGIVMYRALRAALLQSSTLNVALWVALFAAVIHNMVEASFEGQQFQVVFWTLAAMAEAAYVSVHRRLLSGEAH